MTIELDHLFICSQVNAPEIEQILNLGLIEGKRNTHPGQGTANRCIFFDNLMLELLFAIDETELSSSVIQPTRLRERCNYQQTGYSPFGVAFRQLEDTKLSLKTWAYKPPYLPDNLQIDILSNTMPNEPLLFTIPFAKAQDRSVNHPLGIEKITKVEITIPSTQTLSKSIYSLNSLQNTVKFILGMDNLLILEFDRGIQKQAKDFRPFLPLMFRY